ncbi:hypothetical protein N7467_004743 [Penicillium canescens]|nr:hypothetical protein N7467_004743 [Penicillium canescens]
MSSLADPVAVYNRSAGKWRYYKLSIAGAVILGTLTLAGLIFLLGWYIRRARQARRLRNRGSRESDHFGLSTVSLARTSKSIDAFLVKDADPERTSLMFSRSPSPSATIVLDDSEHRNSLAEVYRTSWNASASTLGNAIVETSKQLDSAFDELYPESIDSIRCEPNKPILPLVEHNCRHRGWLWLSSQSRFNLLAYESEPH